MRLFGVLIALCLLTALLWGAVAGSRPAPARPQDATVAVDPAWYARLPADPALAAKAYLDRIPPAMRARGEAVSRTRYWVYAAHILATIAAGGAFMFTGAATALRDRVARITSNASLQVALVAVVALAAFWVLMLPLDVYRAYVRLRQFGFADQPFGDWLGQALLSWAVDTCFYVPGLVAIYAIMRRRRRDWAIWAGAIVMMLAAVSTAIGPGVIEPLFNRMTPLVDGPLKQEILSLARANDVPVTEIVTMDASRQSRLFNAHVSGLGGAARITLDDTTLAGAYRPGVRWVMAHEIGHYVMGHVGQSIVASGLASAFGFGLIAWALAALLRRFGARWGAHEATDAALLPAFWCLFVLVGDLGAPVSNAYTRSQEIAADLYGLNASQEPNGMAEFTIHDADTARLSPTPLDIALFYDHPGDRARVEMAMRWRAEHLAQPNRAPTGPDDTAEARQE